MNVEDGLDFLLSHFETQFPRTISTLMTQNRQIQVNSKDEALRYFKESQYIDCRISAFGRQEIEDEKPNLIFVDLDNISALDEVRALFYKIIGGIPTVINTGNGFAVIQPVNMIPMKNTTLNGNLIDNPAKKFLQFAERYLTNYKCDSGNHPSLKSCLIRVPASYNSKCQKNSENKQVSVIQEWNKIRADVRKLPFKSHLIKLEHSEKQMRSKFLSMPPNEIPYIEELLKKQITDGKKRIFALILCPYLVNVKKLSLSEAEEILSNYFKGYVPISMIRYKLREVMKKGVLPYSLSNMKVNDPELYRIIMQKKLTVF